MLSLGSTEVLLILISVLLPFLLGRFVASKLSSDTRIKVGLVCIAVSVAFFVFGVIRLQNGRNEGWSSRIDTGGVIGCTVGVAGVFFSLPFVFFRRKRHDTHESTPIPKEKPCPFCAETIKAEAKVCRYCGRDVIDSLKS